MVATFLKRLGMTKELPCSPLLESQWGGVGHFTKHASQTRSGLDVNWPLWDLDFPPCHSPILDFSPKLLRQKANDLAGEENITGCIFIVLLFSPLSYGMSFIGQPSSQLLLPFAKKEKSLKARSESKLLLIESNLSDTRTAGYIICLWQPSENICTYTIT